MDSLGLNGQSRTEWSAQPNSHTTQTVDGHHAKFRGRNRKCGQLGACALTPLEQKEQPKGSCV